MSICSGKSLCGHRSYLKRRQREKIASNVSKPDLTLSTRERERHQVQGVERTGNWVTNNAHIDHGPPTKRSGKYKPHAMRHSSSFTHPSQSVPSPQTWYSSKRSSGVSLELEISPVVSLSVDVDLREADLSTSTAASTSQSMSSVVATGSSTSVSSSTSSLSSTTISSNTLIPTSSTSLSAIIPASSVSTSAPSISASLSNSLTLTTITLSTSLTSSASSTLMSTSMTSTLMSTSTSSSTTSSSSSTRMSISSASSSSSSTTLSSSTPASSASSVSSSTVSTNTSTSSRSLTDSTSPISTLTSPLSVGSSSTSSTLSSRSSISTTLVSSRSVASSTMPFSTSMQLSLSSTMSSFTSSDSIASSSVITLSSNTGTIPSTSATRSTFTYTPSLQHTSSPNAASSTLPLNPTLTPSIASSANFSTNTGAIIGATIGGAVALVAAAFAIFLICGRIRRNRSGQFYAGGRGSGRGNRAFGPTAGGYTDEMAEQGVAPLSAKGKRLGILARGISGSSSAQPFNRTISNASVPVWRSPLSDEDADDQYLGAHVPSPVSLAAPGSGFGFGENSSSGHGHEPGSSSGHPSGSAESSGSTYNASSVQSSRSQAHNMPGFGQAVETITAMSPQPLSSHGHSTLLNQDRSQSTGTISSMKRHQSNIHTTNSAGHSSGSSNSHSHSSRLGANSGEAVETQGMTIPVPKLKVNDHSVPPSRPSSPKSFRKGLIERLRGGRSSTQGSSLTITSAPASSSYYPTFPARSSLLNPPLPLPDAPLELPDAPFLQHPPPLPSPALTEDSRMAYTDGLLNPVHSARAGEANNNAGLFAGNQSSLSLGDHVDYSRPFGGFVFNRMDSSTTFTSADTRTTQPAGETPVQHPPDPFVTSERTSMHIPDAVNHGNQDSYFPAG